MTEKNMEITPEQLKQRGDESESKTVEDLSENISSYIEAHKRIVLSKEEIDPNLIPESERGKRAAWVGRLRMFFIDNEGNIQEVNFEKEEIPALNELTGKITLDDLDPEDQHDRGHKIILGEHGWSQADIVLRNELKKLFDVYPLNKIPKEIEKKLVTKSGSKWVDYKRE